MKKAIILIFIYVSFAWSGNFGVFDDKIYKVDGDNLLVTNNRGESWITNNLGSYIYDVLEDNNQLIIIVDGFKIELTSNLKDYKEIDLKLFNTNEYIPIFSKQYLTKYNGEYYLILKVASSSNFNDGYIFKSNNLENFTKVFDGDLNKYLPSITSNTRSRVVERIKEVQENQCKDINGKKECFSSKKLILLDNGEEIVIEESQDNINHQTRSTRSIQNSNLHGFDKCEVATLNNFKDWWTKSPYTVTNLYIGGDSRGCGNNGINSSYVKQISDIGWKVIPTWVGPQASCSGYRNRIDTNNPYSNGVNEAKRAINRLRDINLLSSNGDGGGIVYYDLEQFDTSNSSCLNNSVQFIKGWSATLRINNIKSGIYTSGSTIRNMKAITSDIDSVWVAHWLLPAKYRQDMTISSSYVDNSWSSNNIRQYAGDHNEKWGYTTLNIDSNVISSSLFQNSMELKDFWIKEGTVYTDSSFDAQFKLKNGSDKGIEISAVALSLHDSNHQQERDFKVDYGVYIGAGEIYKTGLSKITTPSKAGTYYVAAKYRKDNGDWVVLNSQEIVIKEKPIPKKPIITGVGSIINPSNSCFGCDKDEAYMQTRQYSPSAVVFQWNHRDSVESCKYLNIVAREVNENGDITNYNKKLDVSVYTKKWNSNTNSKSYDMTLPVTLDSVDSWNTILVSSREPLSQRLNIKASCSSEKTYNESMATNINQSKVESLGEYVWAGNSSIIRRDNPNATQSDGVYRDVAISLKSDKGLTYFQWQPANDCLSIKLKAGMYPDDDGESVDIEAVNMKYWSHKWDDKSQCQGHLPCIIDAPYGANGYYIIKVKTNANAIDSNKISAVCQ